MTLPVAAPAATTPPHDGRAAPIDREKLLPVRTCKVEPSHSSLVTYGIETLRVPDMERRSQIDSRLEAKTAGGSPRPCVARVTSIRTLRSFMPSTSKVHTARRKRIPRSGTRVVEFAADLRRRKGVSLGRRGVEDGR